jgi:iron-sulfur cluster repair protein YtfE (RIC family)
VGGNFKKRKKTKTALERLDRCHRRLEERLEELTDSADKISRGKSLARSWESVGDVLDYLQRAIVRHEEDEEASVFPRLATHPALRPLLNRLRGDHESQRKLVGRLAKLVDDHESPDSALRLKKVSAALSTSYLDHIKREDHQLLPAIARHISAEEQEAIALEMAERRD